jgi:hypothetical protein
MNYKSGRLESAEEVTNMGIGASLFLIAMGAILTFAVTTDLGGIDINVVGIILMVVGGIGILLSIMFWSNFAPRRRSSPTEREVIRDREVL